MSEKEENARLRRWLHAIIMSPDYTGSEMKADAERALQGQEFPDSHPLATKVIALERSLGR